MAKIDWRKDVSKFPEYSNEESTLTGDIVALPIYGGASQDVPTRVYVGRLDHTFDGLDGLEKTIGTVMEFELESDSLVTATRFPAHLTTIAPLYKLTAAGIEFMQQQHNWWQDYQHQIKRLKELSENYSAKGEIRPAE